MTNKGMARDKPLVLVADDDLMMRVLARGALEQAGFEVIDAEDGAQALESFERFLPDIVILDVMMPGMDGYRVCTSLRIHPLGAHVPVLMATGYDDDESINRAYEAGATDFITKPVNWLILGHRMRYIRRASAGASRLRKSEEKNRALIDAIPDLLFQISHDGTVLDFKVPKDFDLKLPEGLLGHHVDDTFLGQAPQPAMRYVKEALRTGEMQVFEHQARLDGKLRSYESRVVTHGKDELLIIVRDITDQKLAEEQIIHLAYHDSLTSLPNRHLLKERLGHALEQARRYRRMVAVLFFDLDRFKRINDTFGHNMGDLLLKRVSERLVGCVSESDHRPRAGEAGFAGTVARLGGDEFTILLTEIAHAHDAAKVARRVLDGLAMPYRLGDHEIFITASLGITLYPFDGEDVDTLLKNADAAMYHAKEQGRNNFQFYTRSMNATAFERLSLENSLRRALDRGEFVLQYQPQVEIASGKIVAVEALIRWQHPDLGIVSPVQFIPLAEETGLIIPIGDWVLRTASAQNKAWQDAGLPPIRVAVNLSSHQFRQKDLLSVVTDTLSATGLDPSYLELELTESAIMQNVEATSKILKKLKARGVRIAIDDFGKGYSSLSYLKRFPLDLLKIDRSFIRDFTTDPDNRAITTAIIAMAHNLNLKVIAEGVETEEQLEFLRQQRCDEMQGFLFSPAVSAEDIGELLAGALSERGRSILLSPERA